MNSGSKAIRMLLLLKMMIKRFSWNTWQTKRPKQILNSKKEKLSDLGAITLNQVRGQRPQRLTRTRKRSLLPKLIFGFQDSGLRKWQEPSRAM